jgi:hypothetical protein
MALDWTTDPRGDDLSEDSTAWSHLLARAYHEIGPPPHELLGALHFARCMGAHLAAGGDSLRLTPGEMDAEEYRELRERVFRRYARELQTLLQTA